MRVSNLTSVLALSLVFYMLNINGWMECLRFQSVSLRAEQSVPGFYEIRRWLLNTDDDAEERINGYMRLRSTDLELCKERGHAQWVGLRFSHLNIPKNAKIEEAYILFTAGETSVRNASLSIRAEASDHAESFENKPRNISSRKKVPGIWIEWSHIKPWNQPGERHRTPELKALVGEVIGRPGWKKGNAMVFIFKGKGKRVARSFDGERKDAPLLVVRYRL